MHMPDLFGSIHPGLAGFASWALQPLLAFAIAAAASRDSEVKEEKVHT